MMMRSITISVHLLIFCLLLSARPAGAQISSMDFSYSEKVLSDYKAIMNTGSEERLDSSLHVGRITYRLLSFDSVWVDIKTFSFSNTARVIQLPENIFFIGKLDSNFRIKEVLASDSVFELIRIVARWISELHFLKPGEGTHVEQKFDGDFETAYRHASVNSQLVLAKSTPQFLQQAGSRQAILFDNYINKSVFNEKSLLTSFMLNEDKRQILGRRTLACIRRRLNLSASSRKGDMSPQPVVDFRKFVLYQRMSPYDRRLQIAHSLLGKETWSGIRQKLASVNELGAEQQFRLKSLIRSLLIIDSSTMNTLRNLIDTLDRRSLQYEIIENAVIESKSREALKFINDQISSDAGNYETLKRLIIKITTANSFTSEIAASLAAILKATTDPDVTNLISLALSNYALQIRDDDPASFQHITTMILSPYSKELTDTLQYLFLVGNAGIENEFDRLISLLRHDPMNKEIVFAFRNFRMSTADSVIRNYILSSDEGQKDIQSMYANRKLDAAFSNALKVKIQDADTRGDTSLLKVLEYLLDHRHEPGVNVQSLLTTRFQTELYRKEIEEFNKQNNLCR